MDSSNKPDGKEQALSGTIYRLPSREKGRPEDAAAELEAPLLCSPAQCAVALQGYAGPQGHFAATEK